MFCVEESEVVIIYRRNSRPAAVILFLGVTQKNREHLKNPTKIEEIQEKNLLTEIEPLQFAF